MDAVLFEWNDSINRNLALVQVYFGDRLRRQLDNTIGATFVKLGRRVESLWASGSAGAGQQASGGPSMDQALLELGGMIYGFNLEMLRAIRTGHVGALLGEEPT